MSIFSQVPMTKISRSRHNLSHQVKASFEAGKINVLFNELAFPGDTWKVGLEQFVRTMPMIAPLMDQMDIKVDAFFTPLRLIWDDFDDFISLGPTGEFSATRPTITLNSVSDPDAIAVSRINHIFGVGGLADYLNFPTNTVFTAGVDTPKIVLDALPFRAYQLIYNEYFRNEVLDTPLTITTASGNLNIALANPIDNVDSYLNFVVQSRGWNKDYFTSALPTPQKGPSVKIPYGDIKIQDDGVLYLKQNGKTPTPPAALGDQTVQTNAIGNYTFQSGKMDQQRMSLGALRLDPENPDYGADMAYYKGLKAAMDSTSLPTIEELRYAEVLQEFYEANARGGTRYKEYLQNIWHTRTRDARLDRPEYLGGYRGPITISDIDQTSQSATTAQGTLAGKGLSSGGNRLFRYHVPEWGIIMVTMSVVPKASYFQGFRRWNLYNDVFDWPNPFFANLGEQEILNKELYNAGDGYNDETFGYTPRYAEAKFIPSSCHGQFRTTLDYWHLARKFGSRPNLNSAFLHINPQEVSRAFPLQVSNDDKFLGTFFFHVDRKMYLPYWGVPRLIHSI